MTRRRDDDHGRPDGETFLGRWSRRKAEARAERPAEEHPPAEVEPTENAPAADQMERPVRPEDLPDIESLTAASDFKVFMQKGVPEELKTLALRKLWRLKPSLANLDGLLEYGGDFTRPATGLAAIKTAYQVGKGYLGPADEPTGPHAPDVAADAAGDTAEQVQPQPPGDRPEHAEPQGPPEPAPDRAGSAEAERAPDVDQGRSTPARRRPLPRRG